MSSRNYNTYKFLYTDDRGRETLKAHRSYLNADGVTEDTPTTQLFLNKVVDTPQVITGTSKGLRYVWAYVGVRRLQAKSPYAPGDQLLIDHINEILAQPQVDCGDYYGEKLLSSGNTSSIQQ